MATIRPFAAIRYAPSFADISNLIAPPYDVLDEAGKAALQARHPANIVTVDLPHLPPKTVGPDPVYTQANATFRAWLSTGTLVRDAKPALYPYTQTYQHAGQSFNRRGFFALVRLSPFGQGQVIPHEKTYANPIEDRLKLMRATQVQLSPIFGLYSDPTNEITSLLHTNVAKPDLTGTLEGVRHDLWSATDPALHQRIIDLMAPRPIYIADGHHRYTTALRFQAEMIEKAGGKLPDDHPAHFCLFVLIPMQDPGLSILPTHRMIGGLDRFDLAAFRSAIQPHFDLVASTVQRQNLPALALRPGVFGLFDGATGKTYELHLRNPDVLKDLEPERAPAWRRLDVAILERFLLDQVIRPRFAAGRELVKGYTPDPAQVAAQTDGQRFQIALLLHSTPLQALEDLGKVNEVMPQKSTYFFPKLATGMVVNPLDR